MRYSCFLVSILLLLTAACSQSSENSNPQTSDTGQSDNGKKDHTDSRITETIRYNQDGQPFLKIRYDYNDQGLLKREIYWDSSAAGVRTREKVYFYDDTLKTRMELRTNQGVQYTGTFQYDEQGRLVREAFTDTALMSWTTYQYNEQDQETEKTSWSGPGQYRKLTYSYNHAHKLDTIRNIDSLGNVLQTDVYHYQEDTLLSKLVMYDAQGNVRANWKYEYDDKGRLVEELEIDPSGNQHILKRYTYNDAGNVIQEESLKYRFYTRRFEYDSNGYLVRERYMDNMGNMNYQTFYEPRP